MILGLLGLAATPACRSTPKNLAPDLEVYRQALDASNAVTAMVPGSAIETAALQRFNDFYAVYSVEAIRRGIRDVYAADAWFGDPFHSVAGIDAIEAYFVRMAEPVEACTFVVDEVQRSGDDYYARWTMRLVSKAAKGDPIEAIGISHVRFNAAGLIVFQQDYWDTSVMFDRLPVVGFWTRLVKGRLAKENKEK